MAAVPVQAVAVHAVSITTGNGDRKSAHDGATARANPSSMQILYDAELRDAGLCTKVSLGLCCHQQVARRWRAFPKA